MFHFNIDSNCLPSPAIPQQYIFCWKFNCRNPMQKPQTIYLNILISFRRNAMIDHLSFWDWVNYLEDSNLLPLWNWWDIHMSFGCLRALGSKCLWRSGMLKRLLREGLPLPAKYDSKTWLFQIRSSPSDSQDVCCWVTPTPLSPHMGSCLSALVLSQVTLRGLGRPWHEIHWHWWTWLLIHEISI